MAATYTRSQYEAQARVLNIQIEHERRRLENLVNIEKDVRENHRRMIMMRLDSFIKRLGELQVKIN